MRHRLKEIPSRVYIRYGLLTIPGTVVLILLLIVVQNWVPLPFWLWVTLILLWIAKEVILFPERGYTRERLAPTGYIQVQSELWKAEIMPGESSIEKNKWVRIMKREGLILFVVPEETKNGFRR